MTVYVANQLIISLTVACIAFGALPVHAAVASKTAAPVATAAPGEQQYFFYNEITGDKQWEDPGDVPYEDSVRLRYWFTPSGQRLFHDPHSFNYVWVELYSEEQQQPYYYNQLTQETTWTMPADLAWRRVPVT